ncbi:MAG: glycosyltransferase family 39 protein, partial [Limisphaerales bacterium]
MNNSDRRINWLTRHPFVVLAIILLATLGPFVNKAVQTDDPLFVWTGQYIQGHPFNFFGGKADWWSSAVPMWTANWNPPFLPYIFALVASIFGWNEIPLHLVCLGFAFGAATGIYSLAKLWCGRPLLAAVIAIFTPAFLVSSSTLMVDVPMLSFWIWSLVVFERAREAKSPWPFVLAGFLAGLAILTKYSAMMLLPLLAAMGVVRLRKPGWWLITLIVPVIFIAGYEFLTTKMYGHGLIFGAARYAQSGSFGFPGGSNARGIIALGFAGGSFLPVLFLAPWLWRWRTLFFGATILFGGLVGAFSFYNPGLIHSWS